VHTVVETPEYLAAAKRAKMTDDERDWVVRYVSENPDAGAIVEGTGGARKVRVPKEGGGKSGGYRVVTYYANENAPVLLISVISKSMVENFSEAAKKFFKSIIKGENRQRRNEKE
jgi:mRNA-degrading endonuclease RelE of RelBE toxin-antitoxin system